MSEGSIVRDTVERILADLADPQTVNADRKTDWEAALWHTMEDNGVTLSWVPERLGGAGASFAVFGTGILHIAHGRAARDGDEGGEDDLLARGRQTPLPAAGAGLSEERADELIAEIRAGRDDR